MIRKLLSSRTGRSTDGPRDGNDAMARLWALRLLVVAGGYDGLIDDHGKLTNPDVARWLALTEPTPQRWYGTRFYHAEVPEEPPTAAWALAPRQRVFRRLHDRYLQAENTTPAAADVPALHHAARLASRMGGLPATEITLLAFLALLEHPGLPLRSTAACLRTNDLTAIRLAFAAVLGVPPTAIGSALAPHGTLLGTGLVCLDAQGPDLASAARLANPAVARQLIPLRPASWQPASSPSRPHNPDS